VVGDLTTIVDGTLHVKFASGYKPRMGDTLELIDGCGENRHFAAVNVDGFRATPIYTRCGIRVRLESPTMHPPYIRSPFLFKG
jgi:hypothetical protein